MTRRLFGGWGWDLSDREIGQALAALGVVSHLTRARANGRSSPGPRLTAGRTRIMLGDAVAAAGAIDRPLVWDVGSRMELQRIIRSVESVRGADLARAWATSQAPDRRLEVRPARGVDERWTFELLAQASRTYVPYFPLPERQDRLRWHWPTRVGYRAEDEGLGDGLFSRLSPTMAGLIDHAVEPIRSDILLAWTHAYTPFAVIARDRLPEATLVIVFESAHEPEPLRRALALARAAEAHGIVVVGLRDLEVDGAAEWFRAFLRDMSHQATLDRALHGAGRISGVYATPELVRTAPLPLAGGALIAGMERTLGTTAPPPPAPALPDGTNEKLGHATPAELSFAVGDEMELHELGRALRTSELPFDSEKEGATDIANVGRAVQPVLRELEERAAEDRYIRAAIEALRRGGPPLPVRRGFRAGSRHRISVSIGPRQEGLIVAAEAIPRDVLADAVGHRLIVVLSEPTILVRPLVRTLELPAFGPSDAAVFELTVPGSTDRVEARITVLHRGRILQTAMLRGPVLSASALDRREASADTGGAAGSGAAIEIIPEADVRPGMAGLDDRRRFDAAIVLNEDRHGRHGGTMISRTRAAQFDFDFIKEAVAGVSRILDRAERDAAFERKLGSAKSMAYLRQLATEGSGLYTAIGQVIERRLGVRDLERLQVLSANPNTMLPVELIYDLPPPTPDAAPTLCENAIEALATGRCEARFHVPTVEDFLPVVCPSGFWGVSKVIERQVADPAEARAGFEVRAAGDQRRHPLRPLAPVLLAASDHVNDVEKKELKRITDALGRLTGGRVTLVRRWHDWAELVQRDPPPVLVVLSHTELAAEDGPALEIAAVGGPERRSVAQIRKSYVNPSGDQPGPLVLLLGCTTAVPLTSFQSFTVQFSAMGAAVVIGTIAPVLGRHASRTAEALLEELGAIGRDRSARKRGVPVGEAIQAVRRRLLARGILMSMSLAAYGDSDWRLPSEA